ncbi:MAG: hypothetical protein M1840_007279 [Geoglossum simile]|nr:MAG: hypothetical protein M1840_007279 [Geoglossum simile]
MVFNLQNNIITRISGLGADFEMTVMGLINKVLDYLFQDALLHTSGTLLTIWMARRTRFAGVCTLDFDLLDELTKPWVTVGNFTSRVRLFGWRKVGWGGVLRYIGSFSVALCVFLLGASINTIALPKARWYPDIRSYPRNQESLTLRTPQAHLQALGWDNWQIKSQEMIGVGSNSSLDVAHSMVGMVAFTAVANLFPTIKENLTGFRSLVGMTDRQNLTSLKIDGGAVYTMSVKGDAIDKIYQHERNNGPAYARRSIGFTGSMNLTLPVGRTICEPASNNRLGNDSSLVIEPASGIAAVSLVLGINSTSINCTFSLQQALYQVQDWTQPGSDQPNISVNNYGMSVIEKVVPLEQELVFLPPSPDDLSMAAAVADQFTAVLPILDALSAGNFTATALLIGGEILKIPEQAGLGAQGLAPVVGTVLQHLITVAQWDTTVPNPELLVRHFPLHYELYGSGPRLPWQWAITAVVLVVIAMMLFDIWLLASYRVRTGPWLSVKGMMLAANAANKMKSVGPQNYLGVETEDAKRSRYFFRERGREGPRAMMLTDIGDGEGLKRRTKYGEEIGV